MMLRRVSSENELSGENEFPLHAVDLGHELLTTAVSVAYVAGSDASSRHSWGYRGVTPRFARRSKVPPRSNEVVVDWSVVRRVARNINTARVVGSFAFGTARRLSKVGRFFGCHFVDYRLTATGAGGEHDRSTGAFLNPAT